MEAILGFIEDIEDVIDAIFALVDKKMAKVDDITAKDADKSNS